MDRSQLRRLVACSADEILSDLSTRQFVCPHRPLAEAMADAAEALGTCPAAAARAVAWLELTPTVAIGRLTRTQLAQLARSLHRFCRQAHLTATGASTEANDASAAGGPAAGRPSPSA